MRDETREKFSELVDLLEEEGDVNVTRSDLTELGRSDPTDPESEPTGVEINLSCYVSFDDGDGGGDENPYRID